MRYEGVVYVSGSTKAWATIEDLDAVEWLGTIGEIRNISPHSGLHTIRIGEGERVGAFAVMEVDYDEEERSGDRSPDEHRSGRTRTKDRTKSLSASAQVRRYRFRYGQSCSAPSWPADAAPDSP